MAIEDAPCREDVLCTRMLAFQALCAAATFAVRFGLAGLSTQWCDDLCVFHRACHCGIA